MTDVLLTAHPFEETPDLDGAFPDLGEGQIATLIERGECRMTRVGEVLYREGDLHYDFVVVLEGKVAVIEG
jgi:thioredoxin reductase (NADPH)